MIRTQQTENGIWLDITGPEKAPDILSAHFGGPPGTDTPFTAFWTGAALRKDLFGFFTSSVPRIWEEAGSPNSLGIIKIFCFGDSIDSTLYDGEARQVLDTLANTSYLDSQFLGAELIRLEYLHMEDDPEYVVWARTVTIPEARRESATDMGVYARPSRFIQLGEMLPSFIESTCAFPWSREAVNTAVDHLFQLAQARSRGQGQLGAAF